MQTIRLRFFVASGRKPLVTFIINGIRWIYTFQDCKNLNDLNKLYGQTTCRHLGRIIHKNFPNLTNYEIKHDIFPFQKLTITEFKTIFAHNSCY